MSHVIELPKREGVEPWPPITAKAGHTFLEFIQEKRGMPYYAPTVQVAVVRRGAYVEFEPINPLAKSFAKLIGRPAFSERQLTVIEDMGMAVERLVR